MWGVRENKDDWRRSEKMPKLLKDFETEAEDSSNLVTETEREEESENLLMYLLKKNLLKNIPLTQIEMDSSIERLLNACFTAAVIYKDHSMNPNFNGIASKDLPKKPNSSN